MNERLRRPPPGWTRDACHGCGGTELRMKDRLCSTCDTIYIAGQKAQAALADEIKAATTTVLEMPQYPTHLPYLGEAGTLSNSPITKAFHAVAWAASKPAAFKPQRSPIAPQYSNVLIPPQQGDYHQFTYGKGDEVRTFDTEVAERLRELYAAIKTGLAAAKQAGQDRGASMLQQLASGEITANQFNDWTMGSR